MPSKRCGACVTRKKRCDRAAPACSQCLYSGRTCPGYSIRLSWPRQTDRKRHVVVPVPSRYTRGQAEGEAVHFIHATNWDVDVFRYLTTQDRTAATIVDDNLCLPLSWAPHQMTEGEAHLLDYFDSTLSKSLTTFREKPLGGLLVRISLSGGSLANVAVHRAMLALSSLLRHGNGLETQRLKHSAIQALASSARHGLTTQNAAQHVAAGLLLCVLEACDPTSPVVRMFSADPVTQVYSHSDTSYHWVWYMMGARDVVSMFSLDWFDSQTELAGLSDWMYHHEVLCKFSLRHWAPGLIKDSLPTQVPLMRPCAWSADSRLVPCTKMQQRNDALRTLSEVVEMVLPPSDPGSASREYRERLLRIRDTIEERLGPDDQDPKDPAELMSRLYRLATIVYLSRASGHGSPRLTAHAHAGLSLLAGMPRCTRLFPLIVLGSEAQTEEERKMVLDLCRGTEQTAPDPRLACLRRRLLQAMWNQNDLLMSERTQPCYLDKLTAVISLCRMLPSLA